MTGLIRSMFRVRSSMFSVRISFAIFAPLRLDSLGGGDGAGQMAAAAEAGRPPAAGPVGRMAGLRLPDRARLRRRGPELAGAIPRGGHRRPEGRAPALRRGQ